MAYGQCVMCRRWGDTERHHVYGGPFRKKSEKYGLVVLLCPLCHRDGPRAVHRCRASREALQRAAQRAAMRARGWTVEEFRELFGKNYLDALPQSEGAKTEARG